MGGGIAGRPVKFIYHDDQSNPQTAVQLATQVVAGRPAVVLGSSLVASCRAVGPLMQNGPVNYCFSPGFHPDPGGYVFSSSISTLDLIDCRSGISALRVGSASPFSSAPTPPAKMRKTASNRPWRN
jgi:hypothetical protein